MIKFFKRISEFRKFLKYADSVGFNLKNPTPIESIAFQTVAAIVLSSQKEFSLKHNELTTYDAIIFTLFIIRMLCITQIGNRAKAEEFSDIYISKVLQYFPKWKEISDKYDNEFFERRVQYYDYIFSNNSQNFDECMEIMLKAFENIITYDHIGQYVRFDENTSLRIIGFDKQFLISMDVKLYYNALPNFFGKLLSDIRNFYN
jgi:hypothetical protein